MNLKVLYSETKPNFWQHILNIFERIFTSIVTTGIGGCLFALLISPFLMLIGLVIGLPRWIYHRLILGKKKEEKEVEEEVKEWGVYFENNHIKIERISGDWFDDIEDKEDYTGRQYEWEDFPLYKLRCTPYIDSISDQIFGMNMEFFQDNLIIQSLDYNNHKSTLISIDLSSATAHVVQELDQDYWLDFKKDNSSLTIKGSKWRKEIEIILEL